VVNGFHPAGTADPVPAADDGEAPADVALPEVPGEEGALDDDDAVDVGATEELETEEVETGELEAGEPVAGAAEVEPQPASSAAHQTPVATVADAAVARMSPSPGATSCGTILGV
jgi:hypothetical protein